MKNILIMGAAGQIGSELVPYLRQIYGADKVIASDLHREVPEEIITGGHYEVLDALDSDSFYALVKKYQIDTIFNLVAILSAKGEDNPMLSWNVNIGALLNCLEIAKEQRCAVFTPSSIGAFGPGTPPDKTPQDTIMRPSTIYGITKVASELLSDYYFQKYKVDTRGLRYPGIVSNVTLPGGGTTDYAVDIYYKAVLDNHFVCNLKPGTYMDMMYMPDALRAAVEVMEASADKLKHRNCFNVTAMSIEPEILASAIRKHIPEFTMSYEINQRKQNIADSWPNSLDDTAAREEWGWKPEFDLDAMTSDMLDILKKKLLKK